MYIKKIDHVRSIPMWFLVWLFLAVVMAICITSGVTYCASNVSWYSENGTLYGVENLSATEDFEVDIPSTENNTPIKEIKYNDLWQGYAFKGNTHIVGLSLKNATNLVKIGNFAFSGCVNITGKLELPVSLYKITKAAFKDTGITEVVVTNPECEITYTAFDEDVTLVFLNDSDIDIFLSMQGNANWNSHKERLTSTQQQDETAVQVVAITNTGKKINTGVEIALNEDLGQTNYLNLIKFLKDAVEDFDHITHNGETVTADTIFTSNEVAIVYKTYANETENITTTYGKNCVLSISKTYSTYQWNNGSTLSTLDVSNLNAGEYTYSCVCDEKNTYTFNVTVQKAQITPNWDFTTILYCEIQSFDFNNICQYADYQLLDNNNNPVTTLPVGEYKIILTLKEQYKQNYELTQTTKQFSVSPVSATLAWNTTTRFTYNRNEISFEPTVIYHCNHKHNKKLKYNNSVLAATNAGEYTITVLGFVDSNFILTQSDLAQTFVIEKREVRVDWSNMELVYNGLPQSCTPHVSDGSVDLELIVTGEQIFASDEPYTATATLKDPTNYILLNSVCEFLITRATETIYLPNTSLTVPYTGDYFLPEYSYNGTQTILYRVGDVDYPFGVKDAGTYDLEIYTNQSQNYNAMSFHCCVTILPVQVTTTKNNLNISASASNGFNLSAKLNANILPTENLDTTGIHKNCKVVQMVELSMLDTDAQNFDNLSFKVNNISAKNLIVYKLTQNGLVKCNYSIQNGFVVLSNATLGTYVILQRTSFFTSPAFYIMTAVLTLTAVALILFFTFKSTRKKNTTLITNPTRITGISLDDLVASAKDVDGDALDYSTMQTTSTKVENNTQTTDSDDKINSCESDLTYTEQDDLDDMHDDE